MYRFVQQDTLTCMTDCAIIERLRANGREWKFHCRSELKEGRPASGSNDAMKQEFRKVQRYAVQLPCTLGSTEGMFDGTILNLSAHGCALTAECLPSKGSYLSLDIDLLNGETPVCIELAGVRWISGPRCGIEFIRISPDVLIQLSAFVLVLDQTP